MMAGTGQSVAERDLSVLVVDDDEDLAAMDGLAFCEAVREREAGQPCLVFTGVFDSHVPRETRERDLGYLEKRGERGQYDRLAERIRERAGRGSTST